ncbi:hypothetical protein [Massilia sp. NR 4-1]|uniref:hypothetical protein n=1 Tax=Massilia sp. NR 4-1 TaxID=1678028 RepID=UPI00067D3FD8|nr:hypothetical protein [Massilia sp. NR 4-1]AKU23086.1 hypothetical protein ACZ75_18165 [Massilia sp. NR 4-1]
MIRAGLHRASALLMFAALLAAAWIYPASKPVLGAALALYLALLWRYPAAWLLLVPALLPVFDLAPWTGWFFLEELDLLLLATCAAGYWRYADAPPGARLPAGLKICLALLAISFAIAAWRGMQPLAPLDANAFSNYVSPYNSLRVLKGFVWGLLLLPLLRHSAGPQLENLRRLFVPGMLLGLAGACLAVGWERAVFPGLFNFASDYRPTAPFSAMHTGGAALDAYLAMAFPFVALWLIGVHDARRLVPGLLLLLLGCYAGLTTFSRDIYLAYACSGAVIALLAGARHVRDGSLTLARLLGGLLLLTLLAWVLAQVFGSGGYRGLAAALGLLGVAFALGGAAQRLQRRGLAVALASALLLACSGLYLLLQGGDAATGKGAYAAYLLAGGVAGAGILLLLFGPQEKQALGLCLAAAAFPALALSAALVSVHWGGGKAWQDTALLTLIAGALAAARLLPPERRPWHLERSTLILGFFGAIVCTTLIPVAGSYYAGSRFATVGGDLDVRLRHWGEALEMMDSDGGTQLLGMGLGRYPEVYLWKNLHGEMPGTFRYEEENGNNRFLRLGTPQYSIGYGEVLRMLQRVDVENGHDYRLSFDVRRKDGKVGMAIGICERWLLYRQNCSYIQSRLKPQEREWQHVDAMLRPQLGHGGLLAAPTQLEIFSDGGSAWLDVDNISLRDAADGRELIRNGSFSAANDYWFFSSDRNHFPWHVKNFAVNTVFEMGWLGALATAALLLVAGGQMAARGLMGELLATICLAALAGCMMVGLFDSIFDVPRLATLFFLLLGAGSLRPAAAPHTGKRRRRRSAPQEEEPLMA